MFEKAAFLLPKEGDISAVLTTKDGIEIVQLVSKKMPTYKPLNQVSSSIKELLVAQKFDGQFASDMRSLMGAGQEAIQEFSKRRWSN